MGVVIPENFGQMNMVFTLAGGGREFMWTHGYFDSAATPGDPVAAGTAWKAALIATGAVHNANNYSTQVIFKRIDVTVTEGGLPLIASIPVNTQGVKTAEMPPMNCSYIVKKGTPLGGRRNRGRIYMPPIYVPEANIGAGGLIESAQVATLQVILANTRAALDATNFKPYLLHSNPAVLPTTVTSWTLEPIIATQRRRMPR